jgi:hypothetical protein
VGGRLIVEKDSPDRIPVLGFVVPGLIVVIVLVNLITGKVYVPRRFVVTFPLLVAYKDSWRFWGVVLLKVGVTAGMFSWFVLANYERWEKWYLRVIIIGLCAAILGTTLFAVGFFA